MTEFIIRWDAGYGEEVDCIEAENLEEAEKYAYEVWKDAVESNAKYGVIGIATDELRDEYGV